MSDDMPAEIRINWTEISEHAITLTPSEFAALRGIDITELATMHDYELTGDLCNTLAELDDDGFQGLTREDIEITRVWESER
jgi:hypothetical protein